MTDCVTVSLHDANGQELSWNGYRRMRCELVEAVGCADQTWTNVDDIEFPTVSLGDGRLSVTASCAVVHVPPGLRFKVGFYSGDVCLPPGARAAFRPRELRLLLTESGVKSLKASHAAPTASRGGFEFL